MANVLDLIGRIFISALFLISAYNKVFNLDGSMSWMEGFGIPGFFFIQQLQLKLFYLLFIIVVGYQARIFCWSSCNFLFNDCFYFSF